MFSSSLGLSVAFPRHFSPPWKVPQTSLSLRRQALPPKCTLRLGYPWTPVRTSCRCPSPGRTAATGPFTPSSTRPCLRPSSASWRFSASKTPSCGRSTKGAVGDSQTILNALQSCLDCVTLTWRTGWRPIMKGDRDGSVKWRRVSALNPEALMFAFTLLGVNRANGSWVFMLVGNRCFFVVGAWGELLSVWNVEVSERGKGASGEALLYFKKILSWKHGLVLLGCGQ